MHHWTIVDTTYIYDGTMEGLLSIVYLCLSNKTIPNKVAITKEYDQNLLETPILVETEVRKAKLVVQTLRSNVSNSTLYYMYTAFLSHNKEKSNVIVRYVICAFKYGKNINSMKHLDYVIKIQRICKNVMGEVHRFYGFIRFKEVSNHILYAAYESDNDILQFLCEHFAERLKKEKWMIHDKKRVQIALYNGHTYTIVDATDFIQYVGEQKEDAYLKLWKEYTKNISIKERENRRCQMHFMPKKYGKHLPETGR